MLVIDEINKAAYRSGQSVQMVSAVEIAELRKRLENAERVRARMGDLRDAVDMLFSFKPQPREKLYGRPAEFAKARERLLSVVAAMSEDE